MNASFTTEELIAEIEQYGLPEWAADKNLTRQDFLMPDKTGKTPLNAAALYGQLDQAVVVLEKNGERFTKEDFLKPNVEGWTPLHAAALNGYLDQAAVVLEKNGECFTKENFLKPDNTGRTPLHWAAETSHLDQIFIAKNWVGRVGEMEELWQAVPEDKKSQIDYPPIRQRALELSVLRVRPVQRLEQGTGSNVSPPDNGIDRSQEGKT
jgi:hypothetical protein